MLKRKLEFNEDQWERNVRCNEDPIRDCKDDRFRGDPDGVSFRVPLNSLGVPIFNSLVNPVNRSNTVNTVNTVDHSNTVDRSNAVNPRLSNLNNLKMDFNPLEDTILSKNLNASLLNLAGDTAYNNQQYFRAIENYASAAKEDHVEAQFKLAEMYRHGIGFHVNVDKALFWYRNARAATKPGRAYQAG